MLGPRTKKGVSKAKPLQNKAKIKKSFRTVAKNTIFKA